MFCFAVGRNKEPILAVLKEHLGDAPEGSLLLEVVSHRVLCRGSGTHLHAMHDGMVVQH